ncbi:MAG: sigma factor [Acetanaerobacterium sp.]
MKDPQTSVVLAQKDEQALSAFIVKNERFILKTAAAVCHRYLTKSDDEWSVALQAFCQAVSLFKPEKGSFSGLAETVIRRRLIDYMRSQQKYTGELPVDPVLFDTPADDDGENIPVRLAVARKVLRQEGDSLKLEIEAASEVFAGFGFSFYDLATCSPKAKKTKSACAKAAAYILRHSQLLDELDRSRQLPIKILEKHAKVPRKILERHRKYIIAAVVILSGEYPFLADYMHTIKEELNK